MNDPALFVRDGDGYAASELALGPWFPGALHGGPPAALMAHVLAGHAPGALRLARISLELVRPVPRGPLSVEVAVVRPGRRVTLLDGTMRDPEGVAVLHARALFLAPTELDATAEPPPPFPGPETGTPNDWHSPTPTFATDGMEIRFVRGAFREVGPAIAWFRLAVPLLAGEPTRGVDRVVAAGDFGNGIAPAVPWEGHTFINPDLTVHVERDPVDEWVALQSHTRVVRGSVALAESVLWDRRGRIGRAVQTLLVARAPVGAATSGETP
ncbi:MAG TPA: thioesterase family protein [Solirubrobacteraceae bacterium]|nr:thioesterase family protein [Solirubrobacteraceae bacterium]